MNADGNYFATYENAVLGTEDAVPATRVQLAEAAVLRASQPTVAVELAAAPAVTHTKCRFWLMHHVRSKLHRRNGSPKILSWRYSCLNSVCFPISNCCCMIFRDNL